MTQVSWTRQLIMAAALFGIGSFCYWLEYNHKPKKEEAEERTKRLVDIKETSVQSIRLINGDKTVVLNCEDFAAKQCKPGDNSKWDLAEPMKVKADDSNVNSLTSSLGNTEATDTIDLKEETPDKRAALLKEYGLDPASRTAPTARRIAVHTPEGETILHLGATHPIGEAIFAAVEKVPGSGKSTGAIDETRVLLVPSHFKGNLEHDLTYWRDKKILSLSAHEVASFSLEGSKGKFGGQRSDGSWTLTEKSETYAGDAENIDTLLNGVAFVTAKEFASEDKTDAKATGLLKGAKPILTLTFQKEPPKPAPSAKPDAVAGPGPVTVTVTVTFLSKAEPPKKKTKDDKSISMVTPKTYVTVSDRDPLYEVDAYAKDRFEKTLKDLRMSKLLSSMERFTAKRIEFSGKPIGEPALVLTNADGKWMAGKEEAPADKVQGTLDKLTGNRIKEFLQGSAIPSGEDRGLKLVVGDDKEPNKKQYLFWKSGDKLYARDLQSNRKEAFQVDNAVIDSLPWNRDFFKKVAPGPGPSASAGPSTAHK